MRISKKDIPAEYDMLIQKFRLIDDTFFNVCFDNYVEGMQLLLRTSLTATILLSSMSSRSRVRTISMVAACVLMFWRRTARESSTTARYSVPTRVPLRVGHATTAA